MSRSLNVNRMRRYASRTTPDEIRRRFDAMSDFYERDSRAWLNKFRHAMVIKHGEQGNRISVYVDQEMGRWIGDVMIVARYAHTQQNNITKSLIKAENININSGLIYENIYKWPNAHNTAFIPRGDI